ncbi:uncharacterized protein LOC116286450 [Actinia tenebrosa]|uniref:Uncharacterized protein LOC116286450 n=1 Tax=Actinia tenebrosa TaxID=6105 RepID=A0A6P8H0B1_ACTTE|nr:uncharacterized protein LOC116286450 [Actinia tenebrosa]
MILRRGNVRDYICFDKNVLVSCVTRTGQETCSPTECIMLSDTRPSMRTAVTHYLLLKDHELRKNLTYVCFSIMESLVIVFFSTLLFHSSDAGTFTWLHWDDTVNVVEDGTAKLNWSVSIGAGKTWLSVKITRGLTTVAGPGDVDMI